MIRLSLRSMLSRKLRTALSVTAILLGVTMISGTYVLTDQIENGFEHIYDLAYAGVDVVLTPRTEFGSTAYGPTGYLDQSLIDSVKAVDGVAGANGYVYGSGSVVINGKPIATGGAPTIVYSYLQGFEADHYDPGAPPTQHGEVGVIKQLADKHHLKVGDTIGLTTEKGLEQVRISGIFTFANSPSMGGATVVHTTLADAQDWYNARGKLSEIYVKARPGVSPDELLAAIRLLLPADVVVKTGAQTAADTTRQLNDGFISVLRTILLVFGGVAVLVGAFIIFNTFSITVAQRLREFALLRTLGATRRQVLATVVGEALAMGLVASAAGLAAGLGAAKIINAIFHAAGADIPTAGMTMAPRTILVGFAVGVGITLVAALFPAWRATRVPPVSALREGAQLPTTRLGRYNSYFAALLGLGGLAVLLAGILGGGSTTQRLYAMGAGAVLLVIATAMVSRHIVRPVAAAVGWPLEKVAPTSGRLARENSVRNTARTAATASAMMIGIGVVVLVAVFAQSLKASFVDAFDSAVKGQFVVTSSSGQGTAMPAGTFAAVLATPGVQDASALAFQPVQVGGKDQTVLYAVSPTAIGSVWRFDWRGGGSDALLSRLQGDSVLIEEQTALKLGLKTGSSLSVVTQQGKRATLRVIGEYRDPVLLGGVTVADSTFATLFSGSQLDPWYIMVRSGSGAEETQTHTALGVSLKSFPTTKVWTRQQYVDEVGRQVNQTLMIIYALLAMSIVISLFGIVNTLVLAVWERTREIGMLRAIGTSRRQIRRIVRYESVITAVIGALLGIILGLAFGYIVTAQLGSMGISFAAPVVELVVILVVAVFAGVLAAILPARRAARLNILEAIHYE